jgi:hypothetical protein
VQAIMCCSFSVIQGGRVDTSTDASNFTPLSTRTVILIYKTRLFTQRSYRVVIPSNSLNTKSQVFGLVAYRVLNLVFSLLKSPP